jgi:hypothetical protein
MVLLLGKMRAQAARMIAALWPLGVRSVYAES